MKLALVCGSQNIIPGGDARVCFAHITDVIDLWKGHPRHKRTPHFLTVCTQLLYQSRVLGSSPPKECRVRTLKLTWGGISPEGASWLGNFITIGNRKHWKNKRQFKCYLKGWGKSYRFLGEGIIEIFKKQIFQLLFLYGYIIEKEC